MGNRFGGANPVATLKVTMGTAPAVFVDAITYTGKNGNSAVPVRIEAESIRSPGDAAVVRGLPTVLGAINGAATVFTHQGSSVQYALSAAAVGAGQGEARLRLRMLVRGGMQVNASVRIYVHAENSPLPASPVASQPLLVQGHAANSGLLMATWQEVDLNLPAFTTLSGQQITVELVDETSAVPALNTALGEQGRHAPWFLDTVRLAPPAVLQPVSGSTDLRAHGRAGLLAADEQADLVAFLLALDGSDAPNGVLGGPLVLDHDAIAAPAIQVLSTQLESDGGGGLPVMTVSIRLSGSVDPSVFGLATSIAGAPAQAIALGDPDARGHRPWTLSVPAPASGTVEVVLIADLGAGNRSSLTVLINADGSISQSN